jgi:hypothetical protein
MQMKSHEGANSHSLYCFRKYLNDSWIYAKVCKELKGLCCGLVVSLVNTLKKIAGNFVKAERLLRVEGSYISLDPCRKVLSL